MKNLFSNSILFIRLLSLSGLFFISSLTQAQRFDDEFSRPLSAVIHEISTRFGVRVKVDADTVGKLVPRADFRIRPYSVEKSFSGVLSLFDYLAVKQTDGSYRIRKYEYMRRTPDDGRKMLDYLNSLYTDSTAWSTRRDCLLSEVRKQLDWENALAGKVVNPKPLLSPLRHYSNYSVQNFALESLPGYYVTGSIYLPSRKGIYPLVLMPNGHWPGGRYNADEQIRFATLARMGVISVSYDLFGWGESELMVGAAAHRSATAHVVQLLNGIAVLDYMLTRKEVDPRRIGANGGSGGGSQVIMLALLDQRIAAACPTVNLASHFDGGCPCESGMPVSLACNGTNNAELMATFAPKPLCVISNDKDWTASVPGLEYPYLQRIYGFYKAGEKLSNIHLAGEGHDFGPNKRKAVYDFFANVFSLNTLPPDETGVTIEEIEKMLSFGPKGEKLPADAVSSLIEVEEALKSDNNK